MAHSKDDFLPGIFPEDAEVPIPARGRRKPLLERAMPLAQPVSGEVSQVTEIRVDPARCKIWSGNGRDYASLSESRCRDLIDSMIAENGQKIPAVVRRLDNDPQADYEVITGTRRHWSVSWLRAHNYPHAMFVATVLALTDEEAFRLADIENRGRVDLSELERARNYIRALDDHYGGVQSKMANRLGVSEGWLSKLLTMAKLPDQIVAAFADPASITVRFGYELANKAAGPQGAALIAAASEIVVEQMAARNAGLAPIDAPTVMRRLLAAGRPKAVKKMRLDVLVRAADGRPAMTLQKCRGRILTLCVDLDAKVEPSELLAGLTAAINRNGR